MDALLERFPRSMSEFNMSEFQFNNRRTLAYSNQSLVNGFDFDEIHSQDSINSPPQPPSESASASILSPEEESDPSNAIMVKYIGDMLMEEDLEGKTCMLQDCMALQAAEKSFYEVLVQNPHPPSPLKSLSSIDQNFHNPDDNFISNGSNAFDSFESNWFSIGLSEYQFQSSCEQPPYVDHIDFGSKSLSLSSSGSSPSDVVDGLLDTPVTHFVEQLVKKESENPDCVSHNKNQKRRSHSPHHHHEDGNLVLEEGRSNKQSAVYTEVSEQMDMFDKVLLCGDKSRICSEEKGLRNGSSLKLQQNGQSKESNGGKKNGGRKKGNKAEMIDLSGLLTQCAQAVASNDQRMATDLLKQIRQHSSPLGDGFQRLAHYFANGLEARLLGNDINQHIVFDLRTPAADILKAYQFYVSACPFKMMSNFLSNRTIRKLTEKAARIHIIDFGILYGFQWPCLIQGLSDRPGGPPKLRITGIELPQPGFKPSERVEETGKRLAKYCERFNVPFEYNAIAKKWETVKLEELKIDRDEVTVVNCLHRLNNLPDDTTVLNSPRDAVLNLIKRINPDMFIHGVINGTYNAPFFLTRFRETLFHFSALFDMFDATIPREDPERMMFEKEVYGWEAKNIIACEGLKRVNRPETYKQWQARILRAGFKQLPLDNDIFRKVRSKVKLGYHKDFVVDRDGEWMLQGWKGRIFDGLSCWKPAF